MIIALAGNQNCGKTTLFNRLTGAHQHVGNWPGVTVEKKSGPLLKKWLPEDAQKIEIVDLPGVYSLAPFSQEEEITRHFLTQQAPDVIVNVVDAAHLERNLYLTLQLLQLGRPVVIALNMMDDVQSRGGSLNVALLSKKLGVPAVPVCARNGQDLATLLRQAQQAYHSNAIPPDQPFCSGAAVQVMQEIVRLLRNNMPLQRSSMQAYPLPAPYATAAALLDGGVEALQLAGTQISEPFHQQLSRSLQRLETQTGLTPAAALAVGRYRYLEQLVADCYSEGAGAQRTLWLDGLLLRSGWAIPAWIAILSLVFLVAFGWPGQWLTDAFTGLLENSIRLLSQVLAKGRIAPGLQNLLLEGLLPGLCSVLSFLPPLMLLMFLLNLLEESGYLARAAFLMDRPLRAVGLSGRSLIPFLLGFGCTVPATLSARGMKNRRDRCLTVLLTPLMSCGAKLPVYVLLANAFFPKHPVLVIASLYLMGILVAMAAGLLLRRTAYAKNEEPFLLELPAYRLPSLRNALQELWRKGWEFVRRTFSVILLVTLAVWVLSNHTFALTPANRLEESMLGVTSGWLSPLFGPCGFGNAAAVAALLTGLLAKENVVSTLTVLMASSAGQLSATAGLQAIFPSGLSAFAFLAFVLLYPPCAAATATIRREVGNPRLTTAVYLGYLLLAWAVSMVIYQVGSLLG